MKEYHVNFLSEDQKIVGILHVPDNINPPAILMAHGFLYGKDEGGVFVAIAKELCKNGFEVLRFDFRGCGESEGNSEDKTVDSEVADLKAATRFLSKQNVDKNKIGIIAASFGNVAALLASQKKIRAYVLSNPGIKLKETFQILFNKNAEEGWEKKFEERNYILYGGKFKISKRFWNQIEKIDLVRKIKKIKAPVMIIQGDRDEYIPIEHSKKLYKMANRPKVLKIIKGAQHGFHDPNSEKQVVKLTLNWFKKWLK